jgi:hypothetical protein
VPNQAQTIQQQQQLQQQQKPLIQNAQIRPASQQQVNIQQQQYVQQNPQQQQTGVVGGGGSVVGVAAVMSEDEILYNRKIEELQQHLPRLERMLANAAGKTNEQSKIKAFIDVIMRNKKVSMEILLRCENSLNVSKNRS